MALTTQQISERLLKKSQGVAETNFPLTTRGVYNEAYGTYNLVKPTDIWTDASLIPSVAPTGMTSGATFGVVKYYDRLLLQIVDGGTSVSFMSPSGETIDIITGKFGYSYIPKIFSNDGFTQLYYGDPLIDSETGIITFYNVSQTEVAINANNPPRISFYKYVGTKGVGAVGNFLPITGGTLTGDLNINITDNSIIGTNSNIALSNNITRTTGNTSTITQGYSSNIIYSGTTTNSGVYGINMSTRNMSSGQVNNLYGIQSYTRNDSTAYVNNLVSGYFSARNSVANGGYYNKMLGLQSFVTNVSTNSSNNDVYGVATTVVNSGFTDSIIGFDATMTNYNTANNVTAVGAYMTSIGTVNDYVIGVKVGSDEHPWTGIVSVPNLYGIYIHKSVSGGTNSYALYSDTVSKSYFKGNISIGMLPTSNALEISGNTKLNGLLTVASDVTANSFITSGGTSSQFVKGDGTLDSTAYSKEPISITYSSLYSLVTTSGLTVGQRYIINDYQTVHTIPNTDIINTGITEPLLVTAISTSNLMSIAYSALYPEDVIYYDIVNNETMVLGCNNTNGGKGYIYRRIDMLKNNDIGFDYRNVKFRRWQISVANTDTDGSVSNWNKGDVVLKTGTAEIYLKLNSTQNVKFTDTSSWKRFEWDNLQYVSPFASNWYLDNNDRLWLVPTTSNYKDYNMFSTVPTTGGTQSSYDYIYENKFYGNNSNIIDNSNSVFFGDSFYDNTIGNSFQNNTIGNSFQNNAIGNSFQNNAIGYYFYYNTIGDNFQNNTIWNDFQNNTIGNDFSYNAIGDNLSYNAIGDNFQNNTIGNNLFNNTIGYYFSYNAIGSDLQNNTIGDFYSNSTIGDNFVNSTIGINFVNNTIGNNFQNNSIGNNFNNNTIGGYFSNTTIESDFLNNTIGSDSQNNTIGYNFSNNAIGDSFNNNTIGYNFSNNAIGDSFNNNTIGNNFQNNTIGNAFNSNTISNDFNHTTGIDFTGSHYVYMTFNTELYTTQGGLQKLRYYDDNDSLVILNANT